MSAYATGSISSAIATSRTRDLAVILAGAAVTAIAAQITIPWEPVPFTLQTLAVMLCGLSLGARRGLASQVAYLAAGAAGMPVFAGGKAGFVWLLGPTAGYLWAFPLAALLLGALADRGWDRKVWTNALALLAANILVLGMGTLWLATSLGLERAWLVGTAPFLIGEALKSVVAILALPAAWKFVGR